MNPRRCTGRYRQSHGLRGSLRTPHRRRRRADDPWKLRYRFYNKYRYPWERGRLRSGQAKPSCLIINGRERIRVKPCNGQCRSIIHDRIYFKPDYHCVDFVITIDATDEPWYDASVECYLDGRHHIDIVGDNWVVPVEIDGHWECNDCMETDAESAPKGYIREQFDTVEALLMDHLMPTFNAIEYLHTHTRVEVWLDYPDHVEVSSSAVRLLEKHASKRKNNFLVPIGQVSLHPCFNRDNAGAVQIYQALAACLARFAQLRR